MRALPMIDDHAIRIQRVFNLRSDIRFPVIIPWNANHS